jgi:hypothetical protein
MLQKSSVRFTVFTLGGYGETVLLAEGLPPAAKQSKVLTAALKRCATPKQHSDGVFPQAGRPQTVRI